MFISCSIRVYFLGISPFLINISLCWWGLLGIRARSWPTALLGLHATGLTLWPCPSVLCYMALLSSLFFPLLSSPLHFSHLFTHLSCLSCTVHPQTHLPQPHPIARPSRTSIIKSVSLIRVEIWYLHWNSLQWIFRISSWINLSVKIIPLPIWWYRGIWFVYLLSPSPKWRYREIRFVDIYFFEITRKMRHKS